MLSNFDDIDIFHHKHYQWKLIENYSAGDMNKIVDSDLQQNSSLTYHLLLRNIDYIHA